MPTGKDGMKSTLGRMAVDSKEVTQKLGASLLGKLYLVNQPVNIRNRSVSSTSEDETMTVIISPEGFA
jgi:hypothetical protein